MAKELFLSPKDIQANIVKLKNFMKSQKLDSFYVSTNDIFLNEYDRIRTEEFKRMIDLKKKMRVEKELTKPKTDKEQILEKKRDWDANVDDIQSKYNSIYKWLKDEGYNVNSARNVISTNT